MIKYLSLSSSIVKIIDVFIKFKCIEKLLKGIEVFELIKTKQKKRKYVTKKKKMKNENKRMWRTRMYTAI